MTISKSVLQVVMALNTDIWPWKGDYQPSLLGICWTISRYAIKRKCQKVVVGKLLNVHISWGPFKTDKMLIYYCQNWQLWQTQEKQLTLTCCSFPILKTMNFMSVTRLFYHRCVRFVLSWRAWTKIPVVLPSLYFVIYLWRLVGLGNLELS